MSAGSEPPELFIDFDYTLFRSNSSERFIAFSRPSVIIALIDFVIRSCIPWRLFRDTNGCRIRDWLCCVIIIVLTPWNYLRWRRAAPEIFERYRNRALEEEIRGTPLGRAVVVTFGMDFVVRALLAGSSWKASSLFATPLLADPRSFYRGKYTSLRDTYGDECLAAAIFISDSEDDRDLLDKTKGRLIDRQGELYEARQSHYIPLRYMGTGKYSRSYTFDQIVLVDVLLGIIATSFDLKSLSYNAATLPFFILSAACIYEIGYFENDHRAAKREAAPTLTANVDRFAGYRIEPAAWLWAASLAVLGLAVQWLLGKSNVVTLAWTMIEWTGAMLVMRVVFHGYNRMSPAPRLYVYPLLQLSKFSYLLIVSPPTPAGTVVITAQISAMWIIYVVYRLGGNQRGVSREHLRAILTAIGLVTLFSTDQIRWRGMAFQSGLVLAWLVVRAAKVRIMSVVVARRSLGAKNA